MPDVPIDATSFHEACSSEAGSILRTRMEPPVPKYTWSPDTALEYTGPPCHLPSSLRAGAGDSLTVAAEGPPAATDGEQTARAAKSNVVHVIRYRWCIMPSPVSGTRSSSRCVGERKLLSPDIRLPFSRMDPKSAEIALPCLKAPANRRL